MKFRSFQQAQPNLGKGCRQDRSKQVLETACQTGGIDAITLACREAWAVSSAVEHYVDIVVVTGSIPVLPTTRPPLNPRF